MKGKLKRKEDNMWVVEYEDVIFGDNRLSLEPNEIQLHPDDVEKMLELDRMFDNLEARININPEVEFDIVEHQKLSGIVKYAKLK
jgi:hypothetical protein